MNEIFIRLYRYTISLSVLVIQTYYLCIDQCNENKDRKKINIKSTIVLWKP